MLAILVGTLSHLCAVVEKRQGGALLMIALEDVNFAAEDSMSIQEKKLYT